MTYKQRATLEKQISRAYIVAAAVILLCYGVLVKGSILLTENKSSMHRLSITAPHYFKQFEASHMTKIQIDPLLTIYSDYNLLPQNIKRRIEESWVGIAHYDFDDESEFAVYSAKINGQNQYWAVESIDVTEWNDTMLFVIDSIVFVIGAFIFVIASLFIKKIAQRLGQPFNELAHQLNTRTSHHSQPLNVTNTQSLELHELLLAINGYRSRIEQAILREQNFTRYVSHELRTPMTVIQGCLSILERQEQPKIQKQQQRIKHALLQMEELTHTFLTLARDEISDLEHAFEFDAEFINNIIEQLEHLIDANQCRLEVQNTPFKCIANKALVAVLLKNILNNAVNCTENGDIMIICNQHKLSVIDSGIGLNKKPRGYDGYGVGLVIVNDICDKYQWQFSLEQNKEKGCTATVIF